MDFVGERANAYLTQSVFSSDVLGCLLLPLPNTVPVSVNFLCRAQIQGLVVDLSHSSICSFAESAHPILSQ